MTDTIIGIALITPFMAGTIAFFYYWVKTLGIEHVLKTLSFLAVAYIATHMLATGLSILLK